MSTKPCRDRAGRRPPRRAAAAIAQSIARAAAIFSRAPATRRLRLNLHKLPEYVCVCVRKERERERGSRSDFFSLGSCGRSFMRVSPSFSESRASKDAPFHGWTPEIAFAMKHSVSGGG